MREPTDVMPATILDVPAQSLDPVESGVDRTGRDPRRAVGPTDVPGLA